MIRLIKRYDSRKLYDTEESRYVSLEEIAGWIRDGQQVRVVDNRTSEDVTSQTLIQIISEEGRRGELPVPSDVWHEVIRRGGEVVSSGVENLQRGMGRLLEASVERVGPVRELRDEARDLRDRLESLESSLEEIEGSMAPPAAAPEGDDEGTAGRKKRRKKRTSRTAAKKASKRRKKKSSKKSKKKATRKAKKRTKKQRATKKKEPRKGARETRDTDERTTETARGA